MIYDITPKKQTVIFGNDSVVIRKYNGGLVGGRTLDCEGYTEDYILAGHVIIKKANGNYAPMPVKAAAEGVPTEYDVLPEGASYVGVLYRSISTAKPAASIMNDGIVNFNLVPYPMNDILGAFKAAVPFITFEVDEEA